MADETSTLSEKSVGSETAVQGQPPVEITSDRAVPAQPPTEKVAPSTEIALSKPSPRVTLKEHLPLFVLILALILWSALSLAISSLIYQSNSPISNEFSQAIQRPQTQFEIALDNWEKSLSILEHAATIAALILGGFWTYYTFIKGRVLTPHLEPSVTGKIIKVGELKFLSATMQLKNTGSSKVDIARSGTIIGVYSFEPKANMDANNDKIEWVRFRAFSVLNDHHWIEPNETIREPTLISLPLIDQVFYKIRFRINSGKDVWTSDSIISGKFEIDTKSKSLNCDVE